MKKFFVIVRFAIAHWPQLVAAAQRVVDEALAISGLAEKLAAELRKAEETE